MQSLRPSLHFKARGTSSAEVCEIASSRGRRVLGKTEAVVVDRGAGGPDNAKLVLEDRGSDIAAAAALNWNLKSIRRGAAVRRVAREKKGTRRRGVRRYVIEELRAGAVKELRYASLPLARGHRSFPSSSAAARAPLSASPTP